MCLISAVANFVHVAMPPADVSFIAVASFSPRSAAPVSGALSVPKPLTAAPALTMVPGRQFMLVMHQTPIVSPKAENAGIADGSRLPIAARMTAPMIAPVPASGMGQSKGHGGAGNEIGNAM